MIAIIFLGVLLLVVVAMAATGSMPSVSVAELVVISVTFGVFFLTGIYVAAALGALGLVTSVAFATRPVHLFFGQIAWNASTNFLLVAVPLFILMGEVMLRSGVSDRLYRALNVWVGRLPGGLLHTNVVSSAVFSAVSGSSIATAATIGSVALPYFERTAYPPRAVLGSLAAGGALGNLIPPGIAFIIYALLTETSVGKLYAAGFVAGGIVSALFVLYILIHGLAARWRPQEGLVRWAERLTSLGDIAPIAFLMFLVLGTIYVGIATPTEAAALGVVGALVLATAGRRLTLSMLVAAMRATARTTSMIGFITVSAFVLNFALSSIRLPQMLASSVVGLPLAPAAVMGVILALYFVVGTFMDAFALMITTLPVVFPIVTAIGYDPIWFGVVSVMLVEIGLISPPDGAVMYVLQGLRPRPGPITDVYWGVLPFLLLYLAGLGLIVAFPELILWLPRRLVS
ncbi:MAG: TRAP transporter large permease [Armatimonadota bacterium]|nr:TRAP transporter large permease [Armatimonadota bacterium]